MIETHGGCTVVKKELTWNLILVVSLDFAFRTCCFDFQARHPGILLSCVDLSSVFCIFCCSVSFAVALLGWFPTSKDLKQVRVLFCIILYRFSEKRTIKVYIS